VDGRDIAAPISGGNHMMTVTKAAALAAAMLWAGEASAVDLGASGMLGYQQGVGIRATGEASRLIPDAPLGLSFSVAYVFMDPGNAEAARSIFINDATNGTPETSGQTWTLGLNAIWYLRVPGTENFGIVLGPRFSAFSGRFHYVGGNEDFTVTTEEWGVGTGVQCSVPLSPHWGIALSAGFDWYPSATLYGHDTSYSTNGTIVNGRNAYAWSDANAAVNQPQYVPSILIGVSWRQ
jgi:hypothetical protein